MCSGKTTLGQALCDRLNIPFIDLDLYIEQKAGKTVKEIFDEQGEDAFREMERASLKELAGTTDVIVACGGGTPCQPGAMDLMNQNGLTIRLEPSERRLVKRLMSGRHKRPLLADINSAEEMFDFMIFTKAKREPFYAKAQHKFDSTLLENPEEIQETVEKFIAKFIEDR